MINVSIIYVNYNCSHLTLQSIDSVIKFTKDITYEIIVVDNASSHEEQSKLKDFCHSHNIQVILSNSNLGFGKANNLGNKYAKGEFLMFLNPDTILINNAIYELYAFAKSHSITTCGGNLYTENNRPIHSYWMIFPSIWAEISTMLSDSPLKIRHRNSHEFNHTGEPKSVAYITGADLLIQRDVFNQINGFDEQFFMYFEETELQHRLKQYGYKIYNVPSAKIIHLESQTLESKEKKLNLFYKSRKIYFSKTHSAFHFRIANCIAKANCYIRISFFLLKNDDKKIIFWKNILKQLSIC